MNLFVNLATTDVARARTFFEAIGWSINPNFSDENAICVVLDDDKFLMVLHQDFFRTFLPDGKTVADPASAVGALVSFDLPDRASVDAFIERAAAAGATIGATQDLGFMYQRQFDDPDGNHFEPFWMDEDAAQHGPPAE